MEDIDLPNINTMEDFNVPSPERVALLKRLQEIMGDVTPHFWAACQICDLSALQTIIHKPIGDLVAHNGSAITMARLCKSNSTIPLL